MSGFPEVDMETFDKVMDINVKGPIFGIEACVPMMHESGGGSIVNVGSLGGHHGSPSLAYTTSKYALRGVSACAAFTYGSWNIRSNVVSPGFIEGTNLTTNALKISEEMLAANPMTGGSLLHRAGRTEELAGACLFLASDFASYTTGVEFTVDGGLNCAGVYGMQQALMGTLTPGGDENQEEETFAGSRSDENITGQWKAMAKTPMGDNEVTFDLKQDGTNLSGTIGIIGNTVSFEKGIIENGEFSFKIKVRGMKATAKGVVSDGKLIGKIKVPIASFTFEATRS